MKKYATEQRKILLSFLQEHPDRQYSIDEIAEHLCTKESISTSAIYRNINAMVEEGSVGRFSRTGTRQFLYQYIGGEGCKDHIHLKCEQCGRLFHMDDAAMEDIVSSVKHTSNFHIDLQKSILYGLCATCA